VVTVAIGERLRFPMARRRPRTRNNENRPDEKGLFGLVSTAIRLMSSAPPGALAFIFGLVALTITAVLLMKIVPKNTPMHDLQPTIFAFLGLTVVTLIGAMVQAAVHKRVQRAQIVEHQETFNAIRRQNRVRH
jgi:hypothetical protein